MIAFSWEAAIVRPSIARLFLIVEATVKRRPSLANVAVLATPAVRLLCSRMERILSVPRATFQCVKKRALMPPDARSVLSGVMDSIARECAKAVI